MPDKSLRLTKRTRAADVQPSTINVEERTVEVVFATDTPCRMWDWDMGYYSETLLFGNSNVRMDRLNAGAPVLDSHNPYAQIGVVERATLDAKKGEGRAVLRFSKNPEADLKFKDVVDGILKNVSVGYWVYAYDLVREADGEISDYEATDWEPNEISMVSVPADPKAGTRTHTEKFNEVTINKKREMPKQPTPTPKKKAAAKPGDNPIPEPKKKATIDPVTKAAERAIQAERSRVISIRKAVRAANFDEDLADTYVEKGYKLESVRKFLLKRLAEKDEKIPGARAGHQPVISVGKEEIDHRREGMSEYLLHRVDPKVKVEKSRHLKGFSLLELARFALESGGVSTAGLERKDIANIALGLQRDAYGAMTTSDFPFVLGNVFHKLLLEQYVLKPRTFTTWARQSKAQDFRQNLRVRISDISAMPEVKEAQEYTATNLTDNQEKYVVKKYGQIVPISWETIINDDLNAFSRMPSAMAAAAAQTQSNLVYGLLLSNPTLAQNGNTLFSAANANYDSVGAALAITSLSTGRQSVRSQKSMKGNYLDLTPKILLVSPYNEVAANQLTSHNYVPVQVGNINPDFFKTLMPIVEPRLLGDGNNGKSWYLMCEPGDIDTIEFAFLEGEGEMFTEQRWNFEKDQFELKARMVFGCGAIDYRGMYKSVGA